MFLLSQWYQSRSYDYTIQTTKTFFVFTLYLASETMTYKKSCKEKYCKIFLKRFATTSVFLYRLAQNPCTQIYPGAKRWHLPAEKNKSECTNLPCFRLAHVSPIKIRVCFRLKPRRVNIRCQMRLQHVFMVEPFATQMATKLRFSTASFFVIVPRRLSRVTFYATISADKCILYWKTII